MEKKKTHISTFTYNGQDVEVLYDKGKISYVFDIGGKRYGYMVKVDGRTKLDVVNAAFALSLNFVEAYAKVSKRK